MSQHTSEDGWKTIQKLMTQVLAKAVETIPPNSVQKWKERLANKIQREIPTLDVQDSAFSKYVLHADAHVLAALESLLGSVIRVLSGNASTPFDEILAQCFAELLGYSPQIPQHARGKVIIVFDPGKLNVEMVMNLKLACPGMTYSVTKHLFTTRLTSMDVALVEVEADRAGAIGNIPVGARLMPVAPIQGIHHILANEDFTGGVDALDTGYLLIRELHILRSYAAAPPPIRALLAAKLPKVTLGFWHDGCFYVAEQTYLTTKVALIPISSHGTTILKEGSYPPFYEVLGVLDGSDQETDHYVKIERSAIDAGAVKVTLQTPAAVADKERVLMIVRAIPDLLAAHVLLSSLGVPVRAANLAILRITGLIESGRSLEPLTAWCRSFLQARMRSRSLSVKEVRDELNKFGIEVESIFAEHLTVNGRKKITGNEELVIPDETTIWVYDDNTFNFTSIVTPDTARADAEVSENVAG